MGAQKIVSSFQCCLHSSKLFLYKHILLKKKATRINIKHQVFNSFNEVVSNLSHDLSETASENFLWNSHCLILSLWYQNKPKQDWKNPNKVNINWFDFLILPLDLTSDLISDNRFLINQRLQLPCTRGIRFF